MMITCLGSQHVQTEMGEGRASTGGAEIQTDTVLMGYPLVSVYLDALTYLPD